MANDKSKKSLDQQGGALAPQISHGVGVVINHSVCDETGKTGIDVDDELLRLQGHEAALERKFTLWSAFGLAFSVTGSWVGYLSCFGQNIIYGGPQMVVFPLIAATFVQGAVTTGLAELASAFPSTGGQYHYAYLLATEQWKRPVAYFTGWFSVLGWWIITSSGTLLATVSTLGLVSFWNKDYVVERWHAYLIYLATIVLTSSPLFLTPRKIGWFTEACLYISISGCLAVLVIALAMHQHFYPGSRLTDDSLGSSGWSYSFSWVLAVGNAMYAFVGTDAASHVAEELPHPNKRVPMIMIGSIVLGFLTVFPLMLPLALGMTDQDAVADAYLPSLEVFYQVTGSKAAATAMQVWTTVVYFNSLCAQWVSAGRLAWALARDKGLPYSDYFAHVDEAKGFPVRTTVLTICFCSLYGLIYLGSSNAFNSIVTSAVLYLNISYAIPQTILLFRGRSMIPDRPFKLSSIAGYACNAFSPVCVAAMVVLYSFPTTSPTTEDTMNYSSAVLVGLLLVITGIWFTIGRKFEGPKADLQSMRLI